MNGIFENSKKIKITLKHTPKHNYQNIEMSYKEVSNEKRENRVYLYLNILIMPFSIITKISNMIRKDQKLKLF